jgi:hypothetical protein
MAYAQTRRRSAPKLPPSGPIAPRRIERVTLPPRRTVPSEQTLAEIIDLAPPWLQEHLRAEVPHQLQQEASGAAPTPRRTNQVSFLDKTKDQDDDDE